MLSPESAFEKLGEDTADAEEERDDQDGDNGAPSTAKARVRKLGLIRRVLLCRSLICRVKFPIAARAIVTAFTSASSAVSKLFLGVCPTPAFGS